MTAAVLARAGLLHVAFAGADVLWSCRRRVDVLLADVLEARTELRTTALDDLPPLRFPGAAVPGTLVAGTYRWPHGRRRPQLWCVHRAAQVLVVTTNGRYERIVVQVADPVVSADEVSRAAAGARGALRR